jgi:hypothetical protein
VRAEDLPDDVHCTIDRNALSYWRRAIMCVGEKMTAQGPIFCVVLRDGEFWQIEAEWPDGAMEQVCKYKAYFEALDWVKTQSAHWLQDRLGIGAS